MSTLSHYIRRILGTSGYRKVQETYDMRWTNRYSFAFVTSVNEAILKTLSNKEKGGIIIFSVDVNALLKGGILNAAKRFCLSLYNRLRQQAKIDRALASVSAGDGEDKPSGITIGNLFKGRYKSPEGQIYNEKSLAVEVLFINGRQLIELATSLAREFRQETVLAKDNATNEIYLVDGN